MGSVVLNGATSGATTITPSDTVTVTVTLPSTGGTLQTSGAGFTTNGVAYASSTSALATGSALTFDGTNLGIGTSSPSTKLDVRGSNVNLVSKVTNTNTAGQAAHQLVADTAAYYIAAFGSAIGGTTWAGLTTNSQVVIEAQSASSFVIGAFNNAAPIVFAQGRAEVARIDTSGNLLVGTTTAWAKFASKASTGQAAGWFSVATNGDAGIFFANASNTTVGQVQVNSSSTAYVTSSDYRLKNTIAPMTGALAKVAQLKPVTYKWKVDGSDGQGFIAHELQAIVPECVTGEKDEVDADGNPRYQGIDTSFLVATLTSALQELSTLITAQQATIQSLTERITALEGART